MSVYSAAMLAIILLGKLLMIIEKCGREALDNVYALAHMMKGSANMISHSGFLFFTLLFRRKIVKFLHVLLTFNSSIHSIFTSSGRKFNYVMAQVFVLVSFYVLRCIIIALDYEFKYIVSVCRFFSMTVSILSVNLVTVLFINLAVVLKRCFRMINTCLCELIQCTGEESAGLYRQISTVIHPQRLIEVNNKSDRPKVRIGHIRRGCDFLCDFVDLLNLNLLNSVHTLVLKTLYVVIFIYDSYSCFVV